MLLAPPSPPDILNAEDVQVIETENNGFCLYDSITKASGIADKSQLSNWKLACSVAQRVQEFINKSNVNNENIFVDAFLSGMEDNVLNGVSGEKGYPLQPAVETDDQPCIMLLNVCRKYVHLDKFTESLWKLKTNDIKDGPLMWPDINSVGLAIASINPEIGWVVYKKKDDGTYEKETDSISLANLYFVQGDNLPLTDELTPLLNPTHMVMLLHIDGNHYQVLQPTETLTQKGGVSYDLLKKWPLPFSATILDSCKLTAVGIAILQQDDNVLLQARGQSNMFGFPGGFFNSEDATVTNTVSREVQEETGLTGLTFDRLMSYVDGDNGTRYTEVYRANVPVGMQIMDNNNEVGIFQPDMLARLGANLIGNGHAWVPIQRLRTAVREYPNAFMPSMGELLTKIQPQGTLPLVGIPVAADLSTGPTSTSNVMMSEQGGAPTQLASIPTQSVSTSSISAQTPQQVTLQDIAVASRLIANAGAAAHALLAPKPYVFPPAKKPVVTAATTTVQPFDASALVNQIRQLTDRIAILEARPVTMLQTQTPEQTPSVTYVNASVGTDLATRSVQPAYIYPKGLPAKPTTAPAVAVGYNKDTFFDENKSVPDWAKDAFDLADVPAACRKVDFYTPNCRSAEVFKSIVTADKVAREDAMYGDSQMDAFRDLQSKIANAADPALRAALERQRESQFPKFKTLEVFVPGPEGGVQPVKIANPYVSYMYRRDVSNAFFSGASNRTNDPNGEMAAANIRALKAVGATRAMRKDKGFAISLLESLWYCGAVPGAGGPRCYPLQTLAQLREYGAAKEQQDANKVAQSLLAHMPATRLAALIMQGLRNAGVRATIVPPQEVSVPLVPAPAPAPVQTQPVTTPISFPQPVIHARFAGRPPALSGLPAYLPTTLGRRP